MWLPEAVDRTRYWHLTRDDDPHSSVSPLQCHPGPGREEGVGHQEDHFISQDGHYLDELRNWTLDVVELERPYQAAKDKSDIKAIIVINPGNPTRHVLTRENLED